jgi:glutaredoxin-related protein
MLSFDIVSFFIVSFDMLSLDMVSFDIVSFFIESCANAGAAAKLRDMTAAARARAMRDRVIGIPPLDVPDGDHPPRRC